MEAEKNRPESQKVRQEKLFQNIYNAASQAGGEDAADEMMKYSCNCLDEEFCEELHIKFINHHVGLHVERLASLFGFNLDKWITKHWASNLQFYTDGLFLSKGEVYSSIYGDICKAQSESLDCQGEE